MPALRVEGRQDEILTFPTSGGATVQVLPMALATVVETTQGVRRYQVIQTEPCALTVRLEVVPGAEGAQVWKSAMARLREFLNAHGLSEVAVREAAEAPGVIHAAASFDKCGQMFARSCSSLEDPRGGIEGLRSKEPKK